VPSSGGRSSSPGRGSTGRRARDLVVLDAIGAADELPADHELEVGRVAESVAVAQGVEGVGEIDLEALGSEHVGVVLGEALRDVADPAAVDDEGAARIAAHAPPARAGSLAAIGSIIAANRSRSP
jgi:hypothetical protein